MPHNNNIHLPIPDEHPCPSEHTPLSHAVPDEMFAVNDLKKPKAVGGASRGEGKTNRAACTYIVQNQRLLLLLLQLLLLLLLLFLLLLKQIANNKQKFTGSSKKCA